MATPLDLRAEAQLDPSLTYPHPRSPHWQHPRQIFLTGATGFLGIYLLAELLTQTSAQIYCLVRAENAREGGERLLNLLRRYQIGRGSVADSRWSQGGLRPPTSWLSRIQPLVGDLAQPYLGWTASQFHDLGSRLDLIYHSAAGVAVTQTYEQLKVINVGGTQTLLDLAQRGQTTPFHYISSLGLFFGQPDPPQGAFRESDSPEPETVKGGYKQTKVVSEFMVHAAQKQGLPACIHRPGRILGHSATGIIDLDHNIKDFLFALLIASVQLQAYPRVSEAIEAAPVDYFSRALVHLARQESAFGCTFHLLNSRPCTWLELVATTQRLGYPLEGMAAEEWVQLFQDQGKQCLTAPIYQFLEMVIAARGTFLFPPKPAISDDLTAPYLESRGNFYPPPALDQRLLDVYFRYFHRVGAVSQAPLSEF
ncbi:MAG: thioester reductase domain-containing protein [Prochlorothrix sp.]